MLQAPWGACFNLSRIRFSPVKKVLFICCLNLCSTHLAAEWYVGGQLYQTQSRVHPAHLGTPQRNLQNKLVSIHARKSFSSDFSLEGRLGIGLNDSTFTDPVFHIGNSFEINQAVSILAINQWDLSHRIAINSLIGLTRLSSTTRSTGTKVGFSSTGERIQEVFTETTTLSDLELSLGAGLNFKLNKRTQLNLEFMRIFDNDRKHELTSTSLGLSFLLE